MYAKIKRTGAFLFAAALILWLIMGSGLSSVSAEGQGRVTITCQSDDVILTGMNWSIYKVGVRENDSSFIADGDFTSYYVRINDFSSEHLSDMAYTLENMAVIEKLSPTGSGSTDENGKVTFSSLEPGLYLLSGKSLYNGMESFKPSPILAEIKENDSEDVLISAKIRHLLTLNGEVVSSTVKKVWDDNGNEYGCRPEDVTVEIYKDGELYQTIELNESNNWTYRWMHEEDYSDWRVKESDVPYGYTVIYRADDRQHAIVNTFDEDSTDITVTTTTVTTDSGTTTARTTTTESVKTTVLTPVTTIGSRLPQTGRFGWAVPIFAFGGLAITAVALRKRNS